MTAIFVTSTGTDIGKTFITAGLIHHLRAQGRTVEALKPVVTGYDSSRASESDPGVLLAALGRRITLDEIDGISPWRYRAALSPDMAARQEDTKVDFALLGEFSLRAVLTRRDVLLIEGVGGIMAPLDEDHTVLDWMMVVHVPLILVAGSYLGTISHTLTALHVLAQRNIDIAAVVVSESETGGASLEETVAAIARFAQPLDVIGVPRRAQDAMLHPAFERIEKLI